MHSECTTTLIIRHLLPDRLQVKIALSPYGGCSRPRHSCGTRRLRTGRHPARQFAHPLSSSAFHAARAARLDKPGRSAMIRELVALGLKSMRPTR